MEPVAELSRRMGYELKRAQAALPAAMDTAARRQRPRRPRPDGPGTRPEFAQISAQRLGDRSGRGLAGVAGEGLGGGDGVAAGTDLDGLLAAGCASEFPDASTAPPRTAEFERRLRRDACSACAAS